MQDWLGALKLRSSAQIDHISPPPYCKICFSTSESFWHAKNNLVNRHQEVGLGQTPPVREIDAHGAHVRRTKESWEDQKAG